MKHKCNVCGQPATKTRETRTGPGVIKKYICDLCGRMSLERFQHPDRYGMAELGHDSGNFTSKRTGGK